MSRDIPGSTSTVDVIGRAVRVAEIDHPGSPTASREIAGRSRDSPGSTSTVDVIGRAVRVAEIDHHGSPISSPEIAGRSTEKPGGQDRPHLKPHLKPGDRGTVARQSGMSRDSQGDRSSSPGGRDRPPRKPHSKPGDRGEIARQARRSRDKRDSPHDSERVEITLNRRTEYSSNWDSIWRRSSPVLIAGRESRESRPDTPRDADRQRRPPTATPPASAPPADHRDTTRLGTAGERRRDPPRDRDPDVTRPGDRAADAILRGRFSPAASPGRFPRPLFPGCRASSLRRSDGAEWIACCRPQSTFAPEPLSFGSGRGAALQAAAKTKGRVQTATGWQHAIHGVPLGRSNLSGRTNGVAQPVAWSATTERSRTSGAQAGGGCVSNTIPAGAE